MTQLLKIHPLDPQPRLITEVVDVLNKNGIIAYPTDSSYALGCSLDNKEGVERIKQLRNLGKEHHFTLMCRDLAELGTYARVSNSIFRLLKKHTPGPYTFILPATHEVPRRLQHPKRKTIGLRLPDHLICLAILSELGEPMMSTTLVLPNVEIPFSDIDMLYDKLKGRVDLIVDGGSCEIEQTTVVDLTEGFPKIVRAGKGNTTPFSEG